MDFNSDGYVDIFAATFSGSPWVSYGSYRGFLKPELVMNRDDSRIILGRYYDYDRRKELGDGWTSKDCTGGKSPKAHCITAAATDWDSDGDLDILMGDRNGRLWLCENEGTASDPKFAVVVKPLIEGDPLPEASFAITSLRAVDWDKDGKTDIVVSGGFNVWLYRNCGEVGIPRLAPPGAVLDALEKEAEGNYYCDVGDVNGDGKWDVVVGGRTYEQDSSEDRPKVLDQKEGDFFVWLYLHTQDSRSSLGENGNTNPDDD